MGGISVYTPQISLPLIFYVVVLSPWPIYTHPNQIHGYASALSVSVNRVCVSVRFFVSPCVSVCVFQHCADRGFMPLPLLGGPRRVVFLCCPSFRVCVCPRIHPCLCFCGISFSAMHRCVFTELDASRDDAELIEFCSQKVKVKVKVTSWSSGAGAYRAGHCALNSHRVCSFSLCGRSDRPHYAPCPSVRSSVCLSVSY